MEWVQENWLAIYGAIVGTIALALNFGRFWLMLQRGRRTLKVESTVSEQAQRHLDQLAKPEDPFARGSLLGPIFDVTVINCSHVSMHIHDVGVEVDEAEGKRAVQALVRSGSHGFLSPLAKSGGDDLPAGSRRSYPIWLKRSYTLPKVIGCYVIDQTGKRYKGKFKSVGEELVVPDKPEEPKKSMQPTGNTSAD
ncbi:hypothetical protein [Chromohalobacter sp. 296-RDG]|uniref:hypothetical protein n=1 Tax=Chromohalobacter sp. 296-RDG TaxID=2994062 RepID=UPI00246888B0|nr:hypothetical protein [Chromohalobacter sp. 296-RDG]